ncbi:MAG: ATP-binding protein, partial [Anaerolineae bacterium]|nr:ATP-binding protein [Anaerolineae bacterium]
MGPIDELENRIRESYNLVSEYETMRQVEDDPRTRLDQDRQIAAQWSLIHSYLDDYLNRVALLHLVVPDDIRQIAAHFPALTVHAESTQIEFVNRDQELDRLDAERLRASRSPYTLIGAPAGYGKSYLLKRILGRIESDEAAAQAWTCRYVDLGLVDGDPPACIARALIGQPARDVQTVVDQIIQALAAPSAGARRAVLLMFDAVERLDAATAQWLHDLFSTLRARTWIDGREIIVVRIIVAGRTPETFWADYERAYPSSLAPQRIWLTPFDAYPIQELIWSQAQAAHVPLDDQIVIEIAQQVHHLSGGHPGVIRALVD